MEAATKRHRAPSPATVDDRELALRFGSLMMCTLSSDGGGVIQAITDSGLSFPQMKALITLAGHTDAEAATVKHVAEELGISLPSTSRAIEDLVRRGLATRLEDPDDRRVRRISLTDEGRGVADELIAARLVGLERFIASLSSVERSKLEGALDVLLERDDIGEAYRSSKKRARR
jgi:DNA-binding MarR family transcriptional regulator